MSNFIQIASPNDFGPTGIEIDWSVNQSTGALIGSPQAIQGRADLYEANGGPLVVANGAGNVVWLRFCDQNDFQVDFRQDDDLLIAKDLLAEQDPRTPVWADNAPIVIEFANPVRGVGAYVRIAGQNVAGIFYTATISALPDSGAGWDLKYAFGTASTAIFPKNTQLRPPFLGVIGANGNRIKRAAFDATRTGNRAYEYLALSSLYVIA